MELTREQKELIVEMYRSGKYHLTEIARINKTTVRNVRKVLGL